MQVIKTSFESTIHNVCADLVRYEAEASVVVKPFYALSARVIAAAGQVFWTVNEVIQFVPRMIGLTVGVAYSEKPSLSRAAEVYGLYFKTLGAQAALGTAACVLPELSHYALELHKPLFSLQLSSLIQTMPDLPHVQKDIRKAYPAIDSVAQLYRRLGLSNQQWKQEVEAAVLAAYQKDPSKGPAYLTTSTKEFQRVFFHTIFFTTAEKFNRDGISREVVDGLHPKIWSEIAEYLTPENKVQLVERLKETIIDHEINNYFLDFYKRMTGFAFRSENTTAILRLLLEKMKEVKGDMVKEKRCTQDDIESMSSEVMTPLRRRAFLKLIDEATLNGDAITFGGVTLTEDFQFFGEKQKLVELKKAYEAIKKEERTVFAGFCHGEEPYGIYKPCAVLLGDFYYHVLERLTKNPDDLDPFSVIDWGSAFI